MSKDDMINKMVEGIYIDFITNCSCSDDSDEVKRAISSVNDFFAQGKIIANYKLELDNLITEVEAAGEKQGFIFGFKTAMEMFEK